MLIDFSVHELAIQELQRIEEEYDCQIVLAGFIGSRVNGLGNESSDYDIRAIALSEQKQEEKNFFVSKVYDTVCLETKIYWFDKIYEDSLEWDRLDKIYPTITGDLEHRLVHDDDMRSMIRLTRVEPILHATSFLEKYQLLADKSLKIVDALDYEYSRAYMNYKKALSGENVNIRKYLYTLYEIFSIRWILQNKTYPKDFYTELSEMNMSQDVFDIIQMLLEINKTVLKENAFIEKQELLNAFIKQELLELEKEISDFSIQNKELTFELAE